MTRPGSVRHNGVLWGVGLALILGVALTARLSGLGEASLDFDEYLHVLPAQQLLVSHQPLLPSGEPYTRALPYTVMVSQSIRWFGSSEAAVRIPSVIFGLGLVLLAGGIATRWWGWGASALVMTLLALHPFCLQISRVCRMYAPFHFLYLGVLWACYEGMEGAHPTRRRVWWWLAAGLGAAVAFHLQPLTADLMMGLLGYLAVQAVVTRRRIYWLPLLLVGMAGGAAVGSGVVDVAAVWHRVNTAPSYAAPWRYDYGFYLRRWWAVDPWTVALIIPSLAWWWRQDARRGWYMACAIAIPFALHSVIFDWKEDRYLLHLIPLMLLVVGSALWSWAEWLAQQLRPMMAQGRGNGQVWRVLPLRDPAVRPRPATIAQALRAGGGGPRSASPTKLDHHF